jgi:NADPH:quinone reductase-like Zn-dependent oxidoreductase
MLAALVSGAGIAHAAPPAPDTTMRKVALEKDGQGYRWKITPAAVPTLGDRQVLVRVHVVGLNRGELSILEPDADADHTGMVPGSDAAGEVVAVGKLVTGIHKGERVTNSPRLPVHA